MEKIQVKIIKSSDPEKLTILRASSLKDQIRFYVNDETYFVAEDPQGKNEITVNLRKDDTEKEDTFLDDFLT